MISRRLFLALTGGAMLAPPVSWSADEVPALLDHVLLGCNDLDRGIAFVEERTGVRAAFGGVHPGRGTRNALLSLGERRYLEIIAPDPKQDAVQPFAVQQLAVIKELTTPRLIGWAAHPGEIEAFTKKLRQSGMAIEGPWPGSRARPDGRVLSWKTISLADDRHGLLPFFIEWAANSVHPSADAPGGCHLERFAVADPDPSELSKLFQRLGIDAPVERGDKPQLRARIAGPRAKFEVSS
jgi:catechol 2,3-dioxygenase-like lactoylglutathione lyase family enzyme